MSEFYKIGDEVLQKGTNKRFVIICIREESFLLLDLDFKTIFISGKNPINGEFYDEDMVPTGRSIDLKGFILAGLGNYDE